MNIITTVIADEDFWNTDAPDHTPDYAVINWSKFTEDEENVE